MARNFSSGKSLENRLKKWLSPTCKGQRFERISDKKIFTLETQKRDGSLVFQGYDGAFDPRYFKRL